jgi:disulfide bond formation protein DsbB
MCLWQRWPHAAAILVGALAVTLGTRVLAYAGAATMLIASGLGFFHAGVEQKWWDGPTTCTSGSTAGLTPEELLTQILNAPVVRCDDIAWQFLGISMAGWNGILSLALAGIWLAAARRA